MFITPTHNPLLPRDPSSEPTGPVPPIPDPLARGIRTTAAILPTQGEDPLSHLAQICDAFQEFNPLDNLETMLVSQYLVLGGTFLSLMTRTTDPDLPPALLERLTRTALSVTRTQHRILRTLRPDNGVSLLADPAMWEHWKQTLLDQEAARIAAGKAAAPASTAEAPSTPRTPVQMAKPEPGRNNLMHSGDSLRAANPGAALMPNPAGHNRTQSAAAPPKPTQSQTPLKGFRRELADHTASVIQPGAGKDLIAQAIAMAATMTARANAVKEPLTQ
ncbi:MAG TPA: hypothetical protein VN702_10270 [Acetobacteraceae bacterium]|nr:hypothetical protein [Acetobacteraceae bacterium]